MCPGREFPYFAGHAKGTFSFAIVDGTSGFLCRIYMTEVVGRARRAGKIQHRYRAPFPMRFRLRSCRGFLVCPEVSFDGILIFIVSIANLSDLCGPSSDAGY